MDTCNFHRLRAIPMLTALALLLPTIAPAWQSPSGIDLSLYDISDPGTPASNTALSARIRNGSSISATADVVFYRGSVFAGTAVEFNRQSVSLPAFTYTRVNAPATASRDGDLFSVCVDPNNQVAESNENNNCATTMVSTSDTDLAISTTGISMSPVGANAGEPVVVNATVRNKKAIASRALVRLFQGHPQSPATKLLGQTTVSVPAGATGVASWTLLRPAGDTNFFVSVDDVYPHEITPADNLAARNVYLKAIVDTGRIRNRDHSSSTPAVGDLLGTGQPVMVFTEHTGTDLAPDSRVTALQVLSDGTTKELWSRSLVPAPSQALSPSIADIDGDGSPDIVVEVTRNLTDTNGAADGEMYVFVLDKSGNTKWSHSWRTPGRAPCHGLTNTLTPALGDMNKDGIADITVVENDLVILDGRNGAELVRKSNVSPDINFCTTRGYAAVADVDGNGSNELILGKFAIHVFNSDGTLRWRSAGHNMYNFSITDMDNDGKAEIVVPVHRSYFDVYDGATGALKKHITPSPWTPNADTIAVTTSVDPAGAPTIVIANNDGLNGTGALDKQLATKWWTGPPMPAGTTENPYTVSLADILGQGRPQVISRSDRRGIGIQDITTGQWLLYTDVYGYGVLDGPAIPVDVDGDGRGEIIIGYGRDKTDNTKLDTEAQFPAVNYLIFGSDHWKKIPNTWNQPVFVANQVDKKLAFRHDYQPYKTHNTWMQQPLRMACDIDYDDDVDQNDINLIFAGRGRAAAPGDWRDIDKDGQITINDSRACTVKCTKSNCAAINQPARILSVSPRTAFPGSSVQVTIRGEFGNFRAGQTTVNFGAGISVGGAAAGSMGPVTVVDTDTAIAKITIAAGQTGDRTVSVATGSITASRAQGFSLSTGNRPPAVTAGTDQRVVLPSAVSLNGSVNDDGLPNGKLTTSWQMVAGPGVVSFSNANGLSTTASFSKQGFYVVRLSATDGQYVASADIGVTALAGNEAPYVSAGPDLVGTQDAAVRINGEVQDDGLPNLASTTAAWSRVSGPGTVSFNPPNAASTSVTFSQPGTYVLRLTANDTQLSASDDVTVTVASPRVQILGVAANSAVPGQQLTVTIKTKYTHFVNGTSEGSFGAGISVNGGGDGGFGKLTVVDATTATAVLQVSSAAMLGARAVSVRTGTEQGSKAEAFTVGTIGVPFTIRPNVSDLLVAPGGSIMASPQVLDAAGNVISSDPSLFTMTVTGKPGQTTGNAPKVTGLSVSFPKLAKRLLHQDVAADPEGNYTDGDPTDPNYGKETGGLYTLTVKLGSTGVAGSVDVAVLPSSTAEITLKGKQYGSELAQVLTEIGEAASRNDLTAMAIGKGQLGNLLHTTEYQVPVMATNNVLAPPNGFPLTANQAVTRFPMAADDAAFSNALSQAITQVRAIRTRIQAITPATLGQADIDALQAAADTYQSISNQLATLAPGTLGVIQNSDKLNLLIRNELPKLLDTISRKSMEILNAVPLPTSLKSEDEMREASFGIGDLVSFIPPAFSIFTNLAGAAKNNIIELGVDLASSLINIAVANALNEAGNSTLAIDMVVGGGQLSFICPNFPNSYVEGSGFSADIENNSVAVIGCINSSPLRTLLTLKPVEDLGAAVKLMWKIKGMVSAMGEGFSIATTANPDEMREGLFSGSQMVFRNGWDRVNQGRLPCTGIVIAFNLESGGFHAVNSNILPSCE